MAVSDLFGVHVRGKKKGSNERTPDRMKTELEKVRCYKLGENVIIFEMDSNSWFNSSLKPQYVKISPPICIKHAFWGPNLNFGGPTSTFFFTCGSRTRAKKNDFWHTSRSKPLVVHLHVFTYGSRTQKKVGYKLCYYLAGHCVAIWSVAD